MTKNRTLLIFFALVFGFSVFADEYSLNICDVGQCYHLKNTLISYSRELGSLYSSINDRKNYAQYDFNNILTVSAQLDEGYAKRQIESFANTGLRECESITSSLSSMFSLQDSLNTFTSSIDCEACADGQCIDISVVTNIFGCVTEINTNLISLSSSVSLSFANISNYLSILSVDVSNINTNLLDGFYNIDSILLSISTTLSQIRLHLSQINEAVHNIFTLISSISTYTRQYLPYLQTISNDLKSFSSNLTFNVDQNYTNQFYYSNLLSFDRFRYYAQGQLKDTLISLYPLSPYDNLQHLRDATIYDAVAAGFESLLISQGSINNYLYWLKAVAGSNRLESVENHILAVSNLVGRLDNYVLNDFSNEIVKISISLSYLTNRVDYTTNFVHLAELAETNNLYLSSIDSKLDVLDYIKILSTTPLSSYSGDVDYYDYLTNLYINGSADSGGVSTNWFERMEILLASLVFGDSDGTNDIPQSVEMEGVDSSTVETALSDFTYNQEFAGTINALNDTRQNFIGVLNGLHTSIKSVSLPASISIGLGGLDGEDTHNFEDMMHGHFQVSFNTGVADRFTIAVRAVTTVSWVLLFFLALWKSGFYLVRKLVYFYRLVTRLLVSVFTR